MAAPGVVGLAPASGSPQGRPVVGLAPADGGGKGRVVVGPAPAAGAPSGSGSGGGVLGFLGSVEGGLKSAAHVVASKADLAAHDIAAIPTGLVTFSEAAVHDLGQKSPGPSWSQLLAHPERALTEDANGSKLAPLLGASAKGFQESLAHPTRDPFQTLLNAAAVVAPVAGVAARGAAAADAARVGDIGAATRALVSKPPVTSRILQVPKLVAPEGEGPAQLTHEPVQLQASASPLARAVQAAHDAVVQRSLDRNVSAAEPSAVARYAGRRVGKVVSETARTAQRTSLVPAQLLERAGRNFDKGVTAKQGQLALFLRSANVTGDEAARYWASQAAKGVNPADTGALAKLAQQVHDQGLIGLGPDGNVAVNADQFPKLARVDNLVKENQASRAQVISEHGLMNPEGMQARLDLVAKKMGVERPGQAYTSLKTSVRRQPQSPIAVARTPVIGKVRGFIRAKPATGEGVAKGLIPDNTTAGVANANREALRYLGTVQHRGQVARYGSDVRRTGDDVLVADPAAAKTGPIPASVDELLGRSKSTLGTISEQEHQGLAAAARAKLEEAIPGLRDRFATDQAAALGTRAPEGYKWVPRQMLGELAQETTPRWALTKAINNVNSAVTAMTVYFKLSHIPQRLTTNATTSLLSGALKPGPIRSAIRMRQALTDREYAEAVAASGTHGYLALPHEGTSRVAQVATRGANFYAHRIDSPFRFLNLVHEAAQEGVKTPAEFRQLLDHARNPVSAGTAPKLDYILRRANRVSMMYDGLGANEKRVLARGLWFYPWTKAAGRFAGHTFGEHPLKAAGIEAAGKTGEAEQAQRLGPLPSYEYGLTPFGSGPSPLTSDFAVLTPFGTVGNVAEAAARPGGVSSFANPVAGAILTALTGINQYGNKTKAPLGDALSELGAPTPEFQILSAAMHKPKPTQIFQKTPVSQALRAVVGPSLPRRTNRAALSSAAARERAGR